MKYNCFFVCNSTSVYLLEFDKVIGIYDLSFSPLGGEFFFDSKCMLFNSDDSVYILEIGLRTTEKLLLKHSNSIDSIKVVNEYYFLVVNTKNISIYDIRNCIMPVK